MTKNDGVSNSTKNGTGHILRDLLSCTVLLNRTNFIPPHHDHNLPQKIEENNSSPESGSCSICSESINLSPLAVQEMEILAKFILSQEQISLILQTEDHSPIFCCKICSSAILSLANLTTQIENITISLRAVISSRNGLFNKLRKESEISELSHEIVANRDSYCSGSIDEEEFSVKVEPIYDDNDDDNRDEITSDPLYEPDMSESDDASSDAANSDVEAESKYTCEICQPKAKFSRYSNYLRHMTNKKIHPDICDDFAISKKTKRLVVPLNQFPCPKCDQSFTSHGAFHRHKSIAHDKVHSQRKCTLCPKVFPHLNLLQRHTRKCHTVPVPSQRGRHSCVMCLKTFSSSGNRNRHVELVHFHDKTSCPYGCETKFGSETEWVTHLEGCDSSKMIMSQPRALSPFVRLNRDPELDKMVQNIAQCFACRQTSGLISDPGRKYEEEIALFKQVFLQQFPSDGGNKFRTNSHLCSTCVPSVISVYGMYQQIIAIQKQIDRNLQIVRDNLQDVNKEKSNNDNKKGEESIDWSLLQMAEDSDDDDDAQDPISDPMMDIELGVAVRLPSSSSDEEENNSTQRRLSSRAAKTKSLQFLADTEIKTEPDDSDYDNYEMDFNPDALPSEDSDCDDNATEKKTEDAKSCEVNVPKISVKRKSPKNKTPTKTMKTNVKRNSISKKKRTALNLPARLEKNKLKPPKNSEGIYPCAKCGKTFRTWRLVLAHEITVCKIVWEKDTLVKLNFTVHECDQCDAKFVFRTHLTRHKNIHLNVKPFTCEKCGSSFTQKQSLTFHQRAYCGGVDEVSPEEREKLLQKVRQNQDRHKKKLKFPCTLCPKKFTTQAKLDAHAQTPHKASSCPICGEEVTKAMLFSHKAQAHPDQVGAHLKCPTCDKCFYSKGGLRRHKRVVHNIPGVGKGKGVRKDSRLRREENVVENRTENGDSTVEENLNDVENA
ncbi:uncharacterized protein LOC110861660 isoform X2 [Folsomia candida]|uniref:uncharacterized protein LOC110861660 isoform X2 n=1 Tax=Folsomia candida TaxID=158441 RepID=UPI00160543C8|nr:uncharacterized protein LOC110861660 isoform X2 [Folsomia candida]